MVIDLSSGWMILLLVGTYVFTGCLGFVLGCCLRIAKNHKTAAYHVTRAQEASKTAIIARCLGCIALISVGKARRRISNDRPLLLSALPLEDI